MKKLICCLLIVCLFTGLLPAAFADETVIYDAADIPAFCRTQAEVVAQYNQAFVAGGSYQDGNKASYYVRMPSLEAPYDQGELKQHTLDAMVAMTNYYRWLSGALPLRSGATNDDGLQRAALIRNFCFAHSVDDQYKPADMDQAFWDSGKVWHNILAWGSTPRGAINNWCNEGYNLSSQSWNTIGHRYTLISAEVSELSFGYAGTIAIGREEKAENTMPVPFTAFPAPGPMPTELLYAKASAWTIQLNQAVFEVRNDNAVTVTVTDLSTGNAYVCTHENGKLVGSTLLSFVQPEPESYLDGYHYQDGSSYQVKITGLTERETGKAAELRYQVDFFSAVDQMATTVSACIPFSAGQCEEDKIHVPESLRDDASLQMLSSAMPRTVAVKTRSGLRFEVPIIGEWSFDAEQRCWTASADASALPPNITDPGGMLQNVQIRPSEKYDYTGQLYCNWDPLQPLGKPDTIHMSRLIGGGSPYTRLFQIKLDGSCLLRYTETSENCTDGSGCTDFSIDAWNEEDSGTWFGIYSSDVFGVFVTSSIEICVTCLHEHTRTERTEPTCTEAGSRDVFCETCGELVIHEELPALGHDYQEVVTDPTCTESGYTTYTCSRCGDSSVADSVPALGHDLVHHDTQPATCTESGWNAYDSCTRCNYSTYEAIPALGHDLVHHEAKPTTCTEVGWTAYDSCSRCDYTTYEEVPALGHDFGDWTETTAPSCTEAGEETRTCSRCTETETRTVEALGHDWVDGDVIVPATYQAPGEMAVTCSRCGANDTRPIDKLPNPFVDVKEENYFFDPVMWALDNEVTSGVDNTHFGPKKTCTRGQIVTFLWRANGSPEPSATESTFSDVGPGNYFYKAVLWAVENGVTAGVGDGMFGPGLACNRAQTMTFLWRAKGSPEPETQENPFSDLQADMYCYKPVLWAAENGITAGMGNGSFGVNATCTRGQIITFLYKAYEPTEE